VDSTALAWPRSGCTWPAARWSRRPVFRHWPW
jgi:hypothetical protein